MDFNIRLKSGLTLRGFISSPGSGLEAVIILVHGIGEHIQRYRDWAARFNKENIGFVGVDLPGHGLSEGRKGHIRDYSVTDEMIRILEDECRKTFPGVPLFIYGHSMGGGIVMDYILRNQPAVAGAVVTSPWLKLSFEPSRAKVFLAGVMKHVFPSLVQSTGLNTADLSRDTDVIDNYKADPLTHGKISVSLFHSAMNAAANSLENAGSLTIPLLLMHGSADRICSPEGSREFSSKTSMVELKIWDDAYHELHNELIKEEVFTYIVNWIKSRLK